MKVKPDDFTERAWEGLINAKYLALSENHQTLETEHLFYSLLKNNEIAIKVVERSGGSIKNLLTKIEELIRSQAKMQKAQESIFLGKIFLYQFQKQIILNNLLKMLLFQVNI